MQASTQWLYLFLCQVGMNNRLQKDKQINSIDAIINKLEKIIGSFSEQEINKLHSFSSTADERAKGFYAGSKEYCDYITNNIIGILKGIIKPNKRETLLIGLFGRFYGRLRDAVQLNNWIYFESTASATRTMFEILVDMILISKDTSSVSIDKYFEYIDLKKYDYMKKYYEYIDAKKCSKNEFYYSAKEYVDNINKSKDVASTIKQVWRAEKLPKTWTGNDLATNAENAELSEIYRYLYARLCWQTHSGLTHVLGFKQDYFINTYGEAHLNIQAFTMRMLRIFIGEFKLDKAMPNLMKSIETVEQVPAISFIIQDLNKMNQATVKPK